MRGLPCRLFMFCVFLVCSAPTPCLAVDIAVGIDGPERSVVPEAVGQLLLVVAQDWDTVPATLRRFERHTTDASWREVGESLPVVLGRNGLAWGRGLHDIAEPWRLVEAPFKQEGDGKAPAGIFNLTTVFGYEEESLAGASMPLLVLDKGQFCVDDVKSRYYNLIVDGSAEKDWDSAEIMHREDGLYRYGVVVAHNASPVRPEAGSCIFMHVERGEGAPTAGCTAMAAPRILELALWLDISRNPVLVQLPQAAYEALREPWSLP